MKENYVILVSSKKSGSRSGKSTFARDFIDACAMRGIGSGQYFELSTPIKQICHQAFGLTDDHLRTDLKDLPCDVKYGGEFVSPRKLMQVIGTDIFREMFDNDIWIRRTGMMIDEFFAASEAELNFALVADVRFDNEIAKFKEFYKNVILVDVFRPNHNTGKTEHISDNGLSLSDDSYDYVLNNSGSLEDLYTLSEGTYYDLLGKSK